MGGNDHAGIVSAHEGRAFRVSADLDRNAIGFLRDLRTTFRRRGKNHVSGGSVSYELGNSSHDTLELRDGTALNCDLVSVIGMEIRVRVAGTIQSLDRNKVSASS